MLKAANDTIVDRYIAWRLSHFHKLGDLSDRFADRVAALLAAEVQRRDAMLTGWDAEIEKRDEAAKRDAVIRDFQSLETRDWLQLQ